MPEALWTPARYPVCRLAVWVGAKLSFAARSHSPGGFPHSYRDQVFAFASKCL